MKTATRQVERDLIPANGNGSRALSMPDVDKDIAPMIAEIKNTLVNAEEAASQQMAETVKVVENGGGEGRYSKTLVVSRDQVVAKWEWSFARD